MRSSWAKSSNTIVVQTAETARLIVEKIRESQLERVGILALEEIPAATPQVCPVGAQPLMDRIRVKPGYEAVAQKWLGNIFIVENDETVFALRTQNPEATFVTRDALLAAHANRTFTCGTTPTRQGIFARRRQIEELEKQLSEVEAEVSGLAARREALLAELETQERRHAEMKDKLSSLHVEAVGYRKEREKVQIERERSEKEYTLLTEESQTNSQQLDDIRAKLENWAQELGAFQERKVAMEQEVERLAQELDGAREKTAEIQNLLKTQQIEYSKMEERSAGLEEKRNSLESQNSQLRVRVESLAKKTEQDRARLQSIEDESARVREERDESSERRNELVTQLSQVREAYGITCQELNEIRLKKEAIQGERSAAADRIQEVEIRLAHEESNFEHQKNISLERYNQQASPQDEAAQLNLEEVPLFQGQVKDEWLSLPTEEKDALMEEHVENLRAKVGRYGEVNLTAINEFEEVQKRHDFLTTQKSDLENSIKILEQAIKRIDETTERRFRETFEGVNEKFQEVFPILFNGGKAKLALTNPENILESGVDIMAMPPGKRLQSISLLSGGEKALTAVSLVLAIFARKPSPFCLLDEVDAPLDEANVSRFNTVIKKMATKSQFILVTHNRKTMDIVDALFGVTMEQAGISKMTSVRLN
ncbi:MAG: hypothetical protein R3B54_03555 [Bdellovibrionota bacterium]